MRQVVRYVLAHINILNVIFLAGQQIDLTENARKTEFVLILHVRSGAPFENEHGNGVAAAHGNLRNIEFGRAVADGRIADKFAVDPNIVARVNTLEIQVQLARREFVGQIKVARVHAAGNAVRQVRRIGLERIIDVGVVWNVVALVKHGLPRTRHGDGIGVFVFIGEKVVACEVVGHIGKAFIIAKIPFAAERLEIGRFGAVKGVCRVFVRIRDKISTRFAFTDRGRARVFVVRFKNCHMSTPFCIIYRQKIYRIKTLR